jgi:hypothetical protein
MNAYELQSLLQKRPSSLGETVGGYRIPAEGERASERFAAVEAAVLILRAGLLNLAHDVDSLRSEVQTLKKRQPKA